MAEPAADPVGEFAAVVRRLRAECPWKAAQTHASLARYLLEETHEALEAIDTGDTGASGGLREELGDLLLQVFLHAAIAEQAGTFTLDDVARDVTAKMVRRNPHVLGPGAGGAGGAGAGGLSPAAVNEAWEAAKAQEKPGRTSVLDGIAPTLPALLLADKVLDRLQRAGVEVRVDPAAGEPGAGVEADLGERLLALVAEARTSGTDPEQALRAAVRRRTPPPAPAG